MIIFISDLFDSICSKNETLNGIAPEINSQSIDWIYLLTTYDSLFALIRAQELLKTPIRQNLEPT